MGQYLKRRKERNIATRENQSGDRQARGSKGRRPMKGAGEEGQGKGQGCAFNSACSEMVRQVQSISCRSTRYSICNYIMDGGGVGVEWGWSLSMMTGE